jgi:cytochrome c-type biogenesis protein CcmH/NrfF
VRRAVALLGLVALLASAGTAGASEQHPTLPEIEGEVLCTVCNEPLDMSSGPFADRERAVIRHWIAAGLTKSQIEQKLVDQFGRNVLLSPPTSGFNVIAWVLPIAGGIAAAVVIAFGAWRWSRGRDSGPPDDSSPSSRIEPELEQRLDAELARFDA